MFARLPSVALSLVAAALVAGCSSATVPTATPRPTTALKTPAPTPVSSPSAVPIPPGPYAVVITNQPRQGATYDVMLIDLQGQVVARVTAKLPLLKPNQTVTLPLVGASNDLVYYLDGDTDIRSLSPSGATALVKTIAAGSKSILAFAVSPNDQRVAVALINQASDFTKDSGRGYVENVADTGNHVDLFSNTALDSIRWPVGWHGADIVDAVGTQCGGPYGSANSSLCGQSYHVISSTTGARRATVCEGPAVQPTDTNQSTLPSGMPVAGGTACVRTEYYYGTNQGKPSEGDILAVDWSNHVTSVVTADKTGQLPVNACFLAPGGAQMACTDNTTQAVTLVAHGASPRSLGRRYSVLGWMDATHLLVDIDSKTLAVVTTSSSAIVNLTLADADKVAMAGVAPGAL
jgi:hypothetical protein